jgi:AhpD family alkylhydroperoxidase
VTAKTPGVPRAAAQRVRIDRQHPEVYKRQIEVARAVRAAVADAGLDRTLVELINVRVSQINGCAYCLHVHVRDALANGETTQRLAVLPAWRDTTLFTAAEQAALTLAESLTTLPDARTQELDYADAARHLTDEQLSAVSWVVVAMNAFNRISIVSRHEVRPQPSAAGPETVSYGATPRKATS